MPASSFAAQCTTPRTGTNPATGMPFPDVPGSAVSENNWLRSWSHDLYLWYDEIVDADPSLYSTPSYFELQKTSATTPSGNPKDRFHFTLPTAQWLALSQSGVSAGYGAEWIVLSPTPPRRVVVAYTEPGSPAAAAGIARGAEVLAVDGVDLVYANDQAGVTVLNAGLFPGNPDETHVLRIRDAAGAAPRDVVLQSAEVESTPVQNVRGITTPTGLVGYLLFNDHIATAEAQLLQAMQQLAGAAVSDLVLDLRYNGGGFLVLASQTAYMIAGSARTAGRTFERLRFNGKHPATDPVTGAPLAPLPFQSTAVGLSAAPGQPLPTLDLSKVFVLTGPNTCSASESIINALRGIDVDVIQIGAGTCGKPYGFYPADNCGTTYFSIQFKGENDKGFGDYADGFSPWNTPGPTGEPIPGCAVADDFSKPLGDPDEARLAAALAYRASGTCPAASGVAPADSMTKPGAAMPPTDGVMPKSPWRENRILLVP